MSTTVGRRTLVKGLAWGAPAIAVAAAAPAVAASSSEPAQYGRLVVAPWSSSKNIRTWKGDQVLTTKWVYFPTTRPGNAVSLSTNNTEAETFATPAASGGSVAWPTNFPSTGTAAPSTYDSTGSTYPYPENLSNGVYTGEKVHVSVKVIGGNVTYESYAASPILSGGMRSATDPGVNTGYVTAAGVQGSGATWPQMDLNDNYKGDQGRTTWSYLAYQSQLDGEATWRTAGECYSYGTMSRAADGMPQWDWDTVLMYPVDNGAAGSSAVSFDLRLSPAQYADAEHLDRTSVPVQFLITVTSPWGVVTYTTAAV
ncbi:hypothetical protein [Actinomyces urogenitalis]|uniref:hypothetical protein n=1 Tax=Actinomyces urogenitalis TaxID=103621 RepID=UPI00242E6A1E|nr:hypothetical protein [Actinomyces urogenitalis]MCI7457939.1 hypothetical protein [Actinomyces urogenitalis]